MHAPVLNFEESIAVAVSPVPSQFSDPEALLDSLGVTVVLLWLEATSELLNLPNIRRPTAPAPRMRALAITIRSTR
jgi:hypothetical protein